MKILEELWYGNVLAEELMPLLSVQAKTVYEKIRENRQELNNLNECEAFCLGFRLGARITYEVMDGTSDVPSIDDERILLGVFRFPKRISAKSGS